MPAPTRAMAPKVRGVLLALHMNPPLYHLFVLTPRSPHVQNLFDMMRESPTPCCPKRERCTVSCASHLLFERQDALVSNSSPVLDCARSIVPPHCAPPPHSVLVPRTSLPLFHRGTCTAEDACYLYGTRRKMFSLRRVALNVPYHGPRHSTPVHVRQCARHNMFAQYRKFRTAITDMGPVCPRAGDRRSVRASRDMSQLRRASYSGRAIRGRSAGRDFDRGSSPTLGSLWTS